MWSLTSMKTVLLTGATGLIGSHILPILKQQGFRIHLFSRSANQVAHADAVFLWNLETGELDEQAFDGVTHIIHLAGAGIAEKHWTDERKAEILSSRVKPAAMLLKALLKRNQQLETYVSASAVGWYGAVTDNHLHAEVEPAAEDFLGETCRLWEQSADAFESISNRVVKIRTGVVLARESGALPQMMKPFKFYSGSPLGSGKQQIPWIHIEDIARVFAEACMNTNWTGAYNASATTSCSNRDFSKALAKTMNRPLLPISVPSFVLKILLGEMSVVVLEGSRISNQKITNAGFEFNYTKLESALENLISIQN